MGARVFPKEALSFEDCQLRLRKEILNVVDAHRSEYSNGVTPKNILDIGCSVGVSTFYLADHYPASTIEVTLDLVNDHRSP